jgi:hypothetical protein
VTPQPYLIYSKVLAWLYPAAASPGSVFETCAGIGIEAEPAQSKNA